MSAVKELRAELRAACNGHPHAKIPWPHRLLHKADEALEEIAADRDGWRKIVGDIAALVPLPSVIKATGTTGDLIDWIKQQVAEREASEARVTALEKALRKNFCPRPCNGRPDDLDVGDCVDFGECGCMNATALSPQARG